MSSIEFDVRRDVTSRSSAASAPATTSISMSYGWVNQPDGCGTSDILQHCLTTIFLCSWSSLCLNIESKRGSRHFLINKLRWMLFTILWPEVIVGVALEQWVSATQSVEDFSGIGFTAWTMQHAFFADMGGFSLKTPDFPAFPVDSQQLLHLIQNK